MTKQELIELLKNSELPKSAMTDNYLEEMLQRSDDEIYKEIRLTKSIEEQDANNDKVSEIDDTKQGCVYILCRRDRPGIVKVGYSSREAKFRAQSYTDRDWLVHAEFSMPVWLAKMTERAAHEVLKIYWLDPKVTGGTANEIFMCELEVAEDAVSLARIECIEKAMKSLGIQPFVIDLLLSRSGLSASRNDDIVEAYEGKLNDLSRKLASSNAKLNTLELSHETLLRELERVTAELKEKDKNYSLKLAELKSEHSEHIRRLESSYLSTTNDFSNEIEILEAFASKKLNPRDFELLRSRFREAVDVLRSIRYQEARKGIS